MSNGPGVDPDLGGVFTICPQQPSRKNVYKTFLTEHYYKVKTKKDPQCKTEGLRGYLVKKIVIGLSETDCLRDSDFLGFGFP